MKEIKQGIKCSQCGDIIVSKHRHDFVVCTCGSVFVDGGDDYLKYGTLKSGAKPIIIEGDK